MSERRGTVRFGLLGPLLVRVGDAALVIGSPKLRIALATLLLAASQPVTVAELADAMWAGDQPENPRRAVQLCVTRLRAQLAAGGAGSPIVTCADGYRIDAPPHIIDLGRFEYWLGQADRAGETHDLDRESAALRRALEQWRGEPLVDIPSETLRRDAVPRLNEQRLQAIERGIGLRLRQGHHGGLIGELVTLTTRYPLRERLWGQLMTALFRGGRRADAIEAYHSVRRLLADELGIDPGDDLRYLHASILAGRLERESSRSVPLPPLPRQLPPDLGAFTGRTGELAALDTLLGGGAGGPTVAVVTGMAGVGKTTLATHWSRRVADRFPDGQMWMDLRGYGPWPPVTPARALTRFLRALGVPGSRIPVEEAELVGVYRSMMDGRRMLVVLDNADDAEHVRALLPGATGCVVLVTSRRRLTSLVSTHAAHSIALGLLSGGEAQELLARRLGANRLAGDAAAVPEIVDLSARLPLALALVAARAATHPEFGLDTLASELRTAHRSLAQHSNVTAG